MSLLFSRLCSAGGGPAIAVSWPPFPHERTPVHPRRPRLRLPGLPRAALPLDVPGRAEPRGPRDVDDGVEAPARGEPRLLRRRLGCAGPDLPRAALHRL